MIAGSFHVRQSGAYPFAPLERSRLIRRTQTPVGTAFLNERVMRAVSIGIALIGLALSWTLGQHSLLVSGSGGWLLRKLDLGPLAV